MKRFKLLVSMAAMIALCFSMFSGFAYTSKAAEDEYVLKFPSFWVGKDSKATIMTELITKFNDANKGKIKVVVEEIADYNAYEDKMKTSIATNQVPDIFLFKSGAIGEIFYKSGKLMDVTSYMKEGWKNSFVTDSLKSTTYNSKVLSIPYEYGVAPIFYNKRLFEKAGITSFPKTYKEFFAACDKLLAKGIIPMSQMTGENAWTSMLYYSQLVVSIGGPDVYRRGLNDRSFLEAAKAMQKIYKYTTKDAIGGGAGQAAAHFLKEETAMLANGPWFIGRIIKEGVNNMYDQVEAAIPPQYEVGKGKYGGTIGFVQTNIGAAKQSDKGKEAAVIKFLKYLTDPVNTKAVSKVSGAMFVIKTPVVATDKVERLQAQISDMVEKAPYVVPHFQLMMKPAVGNEFPQALSGLVGGSKTPQQFINQLAKKNR